MPSSAAQAADKITVARSGIDIAFAPIEVGAEAKIWEHLNLDVHVIDIPGTRIETVLTSGDAQVGLGAGIALSARLKGVPTIAVASIAGPPYNLTIIVPTQSAIKSATDLKGKTVAVSTAGSLTDWLVREVSRQEGWGSDGIKVQPLGDETSRMAALRSGGVDANVAALMQAFLYFGLSALMFIASMIASQQADEREELRQLWLNRSHTREQLAADLQAWCHHAEASGIAALQEFSLRLRAARV